MRVWNEMKNWFLPPGRMPNFFIAGAARAGTTSLWEYLRQHPDIFMPPDFRKKEPSYFCDHYGMKSRRKYLSLFRDAGDRRMVGEASGPYLTAPEAAGRIKAEIPEARILIMLRNPAVRAFSLFKRLRDKGHEQEPDFMEAVALETKRMNDPEFQAGCRHYFGNYLYFHSGLYSAQVRRFFDTFGRDRVKVIVFEEFVAEPGRHVRESFAFLAVDAGFEPKIEVHNASADNTALDPSLRKELLERYAPDIRELESVLGRDVRHLWN
jgi:hypothetical protein